MTPKGIPNVLIPSSLLGGIRRGSAIPLQRQFWAAALFLDVSGFTHITEVASSRGHYGVELITGVLNRYFEIINKIIVPLGGEIVKYGGDSCLILFPVQHGKLPDMPKLCATILKKVEDLDRNLHQEYGFPFRVHGAWNIGNVTLNVVGDIRRHLDYYLHSPMLFELYNMADKAETGQILGPDNPQTSIPLPEKDSQPQSRSRSAKLFLPQDMVRKLQQEPHPAELRNATVLFIRISGKESDNIPLDDFQNVYQRIQSTLLNHLGLVNKIDFNEKGYLIIATFGIPFVYGNDTLRAITAGYRISQFSTKDTHIRIGITYSNLYSGIIGAKRRHEYGIIGNAVNIAARLMSFAQPGEICLSQELIPYLQGHFETQYLAHSKVKGIAEPLIIHRMIRMIPTRWGIMEERFESDPLYIDSKELQNARDALSGEGGFLCVVKGAAGTGKSQLVYKLCRPFWDNEPSFQLIQADSNIQKLRLEIFFYTLRHELGIHQFYVQWQQILDWCESHNLQVDDAILRELLFQGHSSAGRIQVAMNQLLDILILLYPTGRMLVLDDFHHFDPQSQQLLMRLIHHKLYQGDKVIISSSQDLLSDFAPGFAQRELHLQNWDEDTSAHYIRTHIPNITRPAIRLLHQICDGNPRFLSDLVIHIQRHWPSAKDLITHQIIEDMRARGLLPDDMENLLRAEYEELEAYQQQFVRIASIFGRPLRLGELEKVFANIDFALISRAANELLTKGMFRLEPASNAQELSFVNPLLGEAIYRSILMGEKEDNHRRIASFYSSQNSDDERIWELIAHHWLQVGDKDKISWWCGKLARHYQASGALQLSLRMWMHLCDYPKDAPSLITSQLNCAAIHLQLADNDKAEVILKRYQYLDTEEGEHHEKWILLTSRLYINRSQYAELEDFLKPRRQRIQNPDIAEQIDTAHAEAILLSMDRDAIESRALPLWQKLQQEGKESSLDTLAGVIGNYYINRGDYKTALTYYREKQKLAARLKDPISMRIGMAGMGIAYSRLGNKDKAFQHYQKALELASQSGDRNGYSKVLMDLGLYHRNEGDFHKALECFQQSISLAEYIGNKLQISIVTYNIGEMYYHQDDLEKAQDYISRSLEMSIQLQDQMGISFAYDALGDIYFLTENYKEARRIYRSNLLFQHQLNDIEGKAHTLGNLGNLAKVDKRYDRAAKLYNSQIDILSQIGDLDGQGRAWFNLAMLDIEQDNPSLALEKLHQALALFERCHAQYYMEIARDMITQVQDSLPQE